MSVMGVLNDVLDALGHFLSRFKVIGNILGGCNKPPGISLTMVAKVNGAGLYSPHRCLTL